ncbi:hypothetical protein RGQ29_014226 [Quercus rubra]|uniref:At1g61320/AtMIF1 LRR domain-containing protein n=1 Tax=Quercus rubra TaxID=3512 RepID=A0AAN7FLT5_QUERU|nr:hypothetical protein RGQ29_014226 [Quercus rubra]
MAGFSSKRRKIRQPDSEFPLLKCHKTQNDLKDWIGIGKLPDEILVSILSLLPMKQAIITSVLALRWWYLWTSITHLEFDDLSGSHVDEFSLEVFVYGDYFKSDIDSWINFTFQKRVKRLHLIYTCTWASTNRSYTLTPPMLRNYILDSLVQLLECFLSACPLLEFLSVSDSHVMNFKISGPSLKLKQLEITHCTLTSLDIYAVNLMSFKYEGNHECVSLKHTPPLVNAHFGGTYASYIIKSFFQFQSYLSQLETLVLDLRFQKLTCFPKLPKLRNLKQLELELNRCVFCLLLCTSLLRASPSLNRFKIKVNILTFGSFNCGFYDLVYFWVNFTLTTLDYY